MPEDTELESGRSKFSVLSILLITIMPIHRLNFQPPILQNTILIEGRVFTKAIKWKTGGWSGY